MKSQANNSKTQENRKKNTSSSTWLWQSWTFMIRVYRKMLICYENSKWNWAPLHLSPSLYEYPSRASQTKTKHSQKVTALKFNSHYSERCQNTEQHNFFGSFTYDFFFFCASHLSSWVQITWCWTWRSETRREINKTHFIMHYCRLNTTFHFLLVFFPKP